MDERFQFWKNPASWPDDAYGFVFLARAIERIGKAVYTDQWTGNEPVARPPILPPSSLEFNSLAKQANAKEIFQREIAALITSVDRTKLAWETETVKIAGSLSSGGGRSRQIQVLAKESMSFGVSLVANENRNRAEARGRWKHVLTLLKDALRDGRLEFATLPIHGGFFSAPQPKEWWNIIDIENRVTMCRMNPAVPFCLGSFGNGYEYIFVREDNLDSLLPLPPKPKNSEEVKALEDRAIEIYKQIKARDGYITSNIFKDICRKERPKISTTISGRIYKKMHNNA